MENGYVLSTKRVNMLCGKRDFPVIQAVVLIIAVIFVVMNLLVDLLYAALDPRVKYSEESA